MQPGSASHRLAVLGAGVTGSSIAATALGHGAPVVLVDVDEDTLDRAKASIAQQVRHAQLMDAVPSDRPTARRASW